MLRKKKKYRVKKGRILIVLVLLILVFAAGLFTFLKLNQDSYFSANGFEKYGNSFSKEIGGQKQIGEEKLQIDYGEPLSTYISRPDMKHSLPNDTIIKEINSLKKNFELKYGKGSGYNKTALLIDYESYKTPEYVRSVGIHVKTRLENEEKDKINTSHYIKTYNFSNVSGYPISSRDIFTGDYITVYKKNVSQQLKKEYGQELLDNYEKKHLESMGEFLMTDKGFKFFFEEGTVLPKEKDLISVEIPYSTFKGFMKKDVGKNVIFPDKPMVALTYDDGPKEGLSSQLLDIFEKNNAVCTFFELGSQVNSVKDSSQIMKRALSLGCEEGLHSYSHPNLQLYLLIN